jgi:hypothetical protein
MLLLACGAIGLAASGCSRSGDDAVRFRDVVPDNNIRVEGVECAGARPFRHVHRGARFTVEDGAGKEVAAGELPAGRAVNADPTVDWGVERIPTFCVLEFAVNLPRRARYRFRFDRGNPIAFDASLVSRDEPVQITLSG